MPKQNGKSQAKETAVKKLKIGKEEDDIQVVNTIVSCLDIISRQRIGHCVKSLVCDHIECFDLQSFCEVNKISFNYFEKEPTAFRSRYEAIPFVNHVDSELIITEEAPKRKTRGRSEKRQYMVKMTKKRKTPILFKIIPSNENITKASRKLTKKQNTYDFLVRCPLCGAKFASNEIIHDDFMTTIMSYVPEGVKSIEISEDWIVSEVKEKSPFQNQDIVAIEDEEDNGYDSLEEDFDRLLANSKFNNGSSGTAYDPVVID